MNVIIFHAEIKNNPWGPGAFHVRRQYSSCCGIACVGDRWQIRITDAGRPIYFDWNYTAHMQLWHVTSEFIAWQSDLYSSPGAVEHSSLRFFSLSVKKS